MILKKLWIIILRFFGHTKSQRVELAVYIRPELLDLVKKEIERLKQELESYNSIDPCEQSRLVEYYKACLNKLWNKSQVGETL